MGTTLQHVNTGLRGVVDDIVSELQESRESLPKGANNRPPYPTDAFARYAHIEIVNARGPVYKGLEHLMAISLSNVRDTMALSEAKRWLRRAERYIDTHAAELHAQAAPKVLPITAAIRREQRANHAFDMAEFRVMEQPECADTIRAAIQTCREQKQATEQTEAALEHHLVLLTSPTRPVRRLTLESRS